MLGGSTSATQRLRLAPATRAVWRSCRADAEALSSAGAETPRAPELEPPLAVLRKVAFDSPARDLLSREDPRAIDAALATLRTVVCETEPNAKVCTAPAVETAPPPGLPIFNETLLEPVQGEVAFASHVSTSGVVTLAVITRGKADAARLWVARSGDAGSTWKTHKAELAPAPGTERVLLRIPRQDWIVVLREHSGRETLDALSVARSQLVFDAHIALRAGRRFVRAGAIAARVTAPDAAVVAVGGQPGGLQLQYWFGDTMVASTAPPKHGTLVGLLAEDPPQMLLSGVAPTGFFELAQVKIPAPRAPFGEATKTSVAYVDQLTLTDAPAPRCGLPGEPFDIIASQGPKKDAFFALSNRDMYPFKFEPRDGATLLPVCGSCPPGLLERSNAGLRLFLPVRRSLSGLPIDLAAASALGAAGPFGVGCTTTQLLLAYPLGKDLVVQPTEDESWRYAAAEVLARDVAVADVAVLGMPNHSIIAWRSQSRDRLELFAHRRAALTKLRSAPVLRNPSFGFAQKAGRAEGQNGFRSTDAPRAAQSVPSPNLPPFRPSCAIPITL
jgi:hypothetical protein